MGFLGQSQLEREASSSLSDWSLPAWTNHVAGRDAACLGLRSLQQKFAKICLASALSA